MFRLFVSIFVSFQRDAMYAYVYSLQSDEQFDDRAPCELLLSPMRNRKITDYLALVKCSFVKYLFCFGMQQLNAELQKSLFDKQPALDYDNFTVQESDHRQNVQRRQEIDFISEAEGLFHTFKLHTRQACKLPKVA